MLKKKKIPKNLSLKILTITDTFFQILFLQLLTEPFLELIGELRGWNQRANIQ